MARYNHIALPLVMVVLGVLLIVGSLLATVGTTLFPFDQYVGTRASIAGVAFGIGIATAGVQPASHPAWVRAAIIYCGLEVIYEIVWSLFLGLGAFGVVPFVTSLIFAGLLIFLYPNRSALMPANNTRDYTSASRA